jgi:hypothetical protein
MFIKEVQIKNFRSIVNQKFSTGDINVIVGKNDVGKSNFLKALNLFFNDHTDLDTDFDFEVDFSKLGKTGSKMAQEIVIRLELTPPPSYKSKKNILWTKVWRRDGRVPSKEVIIHTDRTKLSDKSRVRYWMERIKFRYVPAIKSERFFQVLLGDLHDTLSDSIEKNILIASTEFTNQIKFATKAMSEAILSRLDLSSELQLPTNLRNIFSVLDFNTKNESVDISLVRRGDGIKTRHIPIILKFLADKENDTRTQGAPKINTIWGFEEPENNLELFRCLEIAKEFYEYSSEIQMFLTTHSPAIYLIDKLNSFYDIPNFKPDKITLLQVSTIQNNGSIISTINKEEDTLNQEMGLMPLVSPYLVIEYKKQNELRNKINELTKLIDSNDLPFVFVEGETDEKYFLKAIEIYNRNDIKFYIKWIGRTIDEDRVEFTGDTALNQTKSFFLANKQYLKSRVVLYYDNDTDKQEENTGNLYIRRMPTNSNNNLYKKGIENNLVLPTDFPKTQFYSERKKTNDYGAENIIRDLDKQKLCDWICNKLEKKEQEKILSIINSMLDNLKSCFE